MSHIHQLLVFTSFWCLLSAAFVMTSITNCNFEDTVSLVNIRPYENGSYDYNGLRIPKNMTAIYDYELLTDGLRVPAPPHRRGCACKLKQCIQMCCLPTASLDKDSMKCVTQPNLNLENVNEVEIFNADFDSRLVDVYKEFVPQQRMPCEKFAILSPSEYDDDANIVFENGTLLLAVTNKLIPYWDYCLTPYMFNDTFSLSPVVCFAKTKVQTYVNMSLLAISVPFLLITIWVYLYVPQLRCLHNTCLICFLATFAIGSSFLSSTAWISYSLAACRVIGFLCYFFMISAFFWLNITCFDLWLSIRDIRYELQSGNPKWRFVYYSAYVWSGAFSLTISVLAIEFSNIEVSWKPGIGIGQCFVNPRTAMLYFHGPSGMLILFNILFFIMSVWDLYQIKEDSYAIKNESGQQYKFSTFLRLFLVMGISWIMEVLPNFIPTNGLFIFQIFNILNSSQGIIMFVVLVLKTRVLTLLKDRWNR